MSLRRDMKGQISPLIHGEILGSGSDGMPLASRPFLPDSDSEFQKGSKLLPSRGKSLTDD